MMNVIKGLLDSIEHVTGPVTLVAFGLVVLAALYYRSVRDHRGLEFLYRLLENKLTKQHFYDLCVKLLNRVFLVGLIITFLAFVAWLIPKLTESDSASSPPAATTKPLDHAPTLPRDYPSEDEIIDFPSKEEVEKSPAVPPEDVNFYYENATGIPMKLILFNFHYRYFPVDDDPMAPKGAWRSWDFPATNRFLTYSDFERGTGWYAFFVLRPDTREYWQLGTKNIFYSEWPTLTVESTGDTKDPFKAVFSSLETNDE